MQDSMGRRASGRDKILEAGEALFMRHGVYRVTVQEICRAAGVSKVTFYRYFPNKVRLALEILRNQIGEAEARYCRIRDQEIPFEEKAREIIRMKLEYSRDMSSEMLADIYTHPDSEIAEFIKHKAEENLRTYRRDFIDAQKRGEIRRDIKPEFMFYFLNHMLEMLEDERLISLYETPQELTRELVSFFFYAILPRTGASGSLDLDESPKEGRP